MPTLESRELELERANDRFYRAFESLDIKEMEPVWAADRPVKCVHPGWNVCSGWPAVRDSWVLIFNHTPSIRFELTDLDIVVQKDVGWVTCMEHITTVRDGEPETSRVLATNLYLRQGGEWRMVLHHGSPVFMQERPQTAA